MVRLVADAGVPRRGLPSRRRPSHRGPRLVPPPAGYRLACITARNFHLHTSGKRRDTAWEVLADAFPHLLARAKQLVVSYQGAGT